MLLYHYCDNKKMANIISSHTLRMSDITKSNDYEEIQLFYPHIIFAIEKEYRRNPFAFEYEGERDFVAIKKLLQTTRQFIDHDFEMGEMTSFVVCFCEEGDALGQWRGYADGGKGGAIGFSLEELREYCNSYENIISLVKVKYISQEEWNTLIEVKAKEVLEEFQKEIDWLTDKFGALFDTDEHEILLLERMRHIIKRVLVSSLEYKNKAFSEEKEWRIFFEEGITKNPEWLFEDKDEKIMKYHPIISRLKNKIEFNVTEDDWIPYYPISLFELSDNPVKEVILGPKNNILKSDFELYAGKNKMKNIAFKLSKISFRG